MVNLDYSKTIILHDVTLDPTVEVGPYCIIETGNIGPNTIIGPYTHVMRNSVVGRGCTLEGCCIEGAIIGDYSKIYRGAHIMMGARIGTQCLIGGNCFIADGAIIGNNVRMMLNAGIGRCITIEDDVRIGPNVVFTNSSGPNDTLKPMRVGKGAFIGSNVTTTPGVNIGAGAVVGCGSVVTRDVPDGVIVAGNPARVIGHV